VGPWLAQQASARQEVSGTDPTAAGFPASTSFVCTGDSTQQHEDSSVALS